MPYDPARHHRRSIRLKGYDYTQPGAYFITLCTQNREHLFGAVVEGEMRLNAWGKIAREEWFTTARLRPYVRLDEREFVVMPNHVHGIIWIVDDDDDDDDDDVGAQRRCAPAGTQQHCAPTAGMQQRCAPTMTTTTTIQSINVAPGSLGAIVRAFKSASNPPSPNASTPHAARPAPRSGNAIITNASSGTKPPWRTSAPISLPTRCAGRATAKTPRRPRLWTKMIITAA